MASVTGMGLIFIAVGFLVIPGVIYNNLNNTGLITAQTLTCPGWPNVTCQGSVSSGCQVNSNYCTLNGQTVSFFNQASPFTSLISGNVLGAFSLITSNGRSTSHGPFDAIGSNNFIMGNCLVQDNNKSSVGLTQWGFLQCTAANQDGSNMTKADAKLTRNMTNWNAQYFGSAVTVPFYQLKNYVSGSGNPDLSCNWQFQLNYTFSSVAYDGWTWYGCDYAKFSAFSGSTLSLAGVKANNVTSFVVAVPFGQGLLATANSHVCPFNPAGNGHVQCYYVSVPIQFENWDSESCFATDTGSTRQTLNFLISGQCDNWYTSFKQQTQNNGSNFGLLTPFVTFFLGIIFFFLGLGINFSFGGSILGTGSTVGGGVNRQGTKLMQVVGLGLVGWSVLYSEFNVWFTSSLLPYGLDGATGIISILLTGMFFFGIYEWSTTG